MKKKNIFGRTFLELTGCIHNHTIYSHDCSIKLSRLIRAAKLRELDYVTINDHLNMKAINDEYVLKEKDLIIIVGAEINDTTNNHHFLVFNADKIIKGKEVDEYVNYYSQSGAIGFAAHPFEKRICDKFRKYEWKQIDVDNFDGIEIWNYLSEWIGKLKPKFNGIFMVIFPSLFIRKPMREVLSWWDKLNREGKRRSAIGSVDAHTEQMKKFGISFKFLRHRTLYKSIRTNLLIEDNRELNEENLLLAIKNGNSYIVNYMKGNPYNFFAGISGSDGNNAIFGEEIEFCDDLKFYFRLPMIAKITLFKDGKKIVVKRDDKGFFPIYDKGNYRLEITRFGAGWIYTNNIYVV